MAICKWCLQEMRDGVSCDANLEITFPDEEDYNTVRVSGDGRCHDCKAPVGGFHHPGCDAERCPRCGGQLISCGCLDEPDSQSTRLDE